MSAHTMTSAARARARASDPSTSHEAAAMAEHLAASHATAVLKVLDEADDPMGAEQIAAACGLAPYEIRKRLPELERDGAITVVPGARKTKAGRSERLWRRVRPCS